MPEEDVIALIVKRDDAPSFEFEFEVAQRNKETADRLSQPRVEVVDDDLRTLRTVCSAASDVLVVPDAGQLEVGRRPVRQVNHHNAIRFASILIHD